MRILIIGNGAREHIITERLSEDSSVLSIMSKKNPAIAKISEDYYICDITNTSEVKAWASGKNIDLAFVSPDPVLAVGMSDALEELGIPVASPSKDVADIECNKEFARSLMQDHLIPGLAEYRLITNEKEALSAIKEFNNSVAIKPIGLTGGKGVKISGDHFTNVNEGMSYVKELLLKDKKLLIEEKLKGEEFTLQAFSDGNSLVFMPPVQDHKRAFENDEGENTGGMGSYSTGKILPFMNESDLEKAKIIMKKTIDALKKERSPFKGVLYGQFMLTKDGPKIIEYNARFGDPEAMNVLSLLQTSLTDIFLGISEGKLPNAVFSSNSTVVKYLVPNGYPSKPIKDSPVSINLPCLSSKGTNMYYASVYEKDNQIFTTSSRAFALISSSKLLKDAEIKVENSMNCISGPLWHRKDIGTENLIDKRIKHMDKLRGEKK
ncbi:MAG: phosphoribosylamine--glycine ligase [Candidatus ainarchaeum sp.]|nr:phosphoribosylamine--glycine ligase [Candidatus ainarchaeum sp.]